MPPAGVTFLEKRANRIAGVMAAPYDWW